MAEGMKVLRLHYPVATLVNSFARQAICYNSNDMRANSRDFELVEKVFSDIGTSTRIAKEVMLKMQESNDQRLHSLEEEIQLMQSNLRHANKMNENQNNHLRFLLGANCFLNARVASQETHLQKEKDIYEEILKECEYLKRQISTERSRC
ncbi:hypothetical protein DPMN_089839 [Dreissena polymorpha]|uniref:Uncharacterized protein n=1 Tax=Dreissena polymorpha TaxID=45954 RepID=A0A9D4QXT3_DREPO|nr:hypothetical protein DPMN_089839 [Dreissena polymorpha]